MVPRQPAMHGPAPLGDECLAGVGRVGGRSGVAGSERPARWQRTVVGGPLR